MTRTVYDQVPAVVREALEVASAHDISKFLDCFVADAAVDDWGRVFTGRQQSRRWSDAEFIGKKGSCPTFASPPTAIASWFTRG
jgi:hypothetical protein